MPSLLFALSTPGWSEGALALDSHRFMVVISRIHQLRDLRTSKRSKGMRWRPPCIDVVLPPKRDSDPLRRESDRTAACRGRWILLSPAGGKH